MDTKHSPRRPPEDELNREQLAEFAELFSGLKRLEYPGHPSEEILRTYVANRLSDSPGVGRVGATFRDEQAFEKFLQGRVPRWTRSDVAMHILTCAVCQQHVMSLRARRWQLSSLARQQPSEQSWRRRFALGALAGAVAAAIIAAIWLWPSSPPSPACWIEEQCWQQVVQSTPQTGSIMVVYRSSPGRF